MQTRVYFSENFNKKMFGNALGKALFVELFQNKNKKAININFLVSLYTTNNNFSYVDLLNGFIIAIKDACQEILNRINLTIRKQFK
tara:strand:+ start:36 stop:293 length:258 start_codon:yes stop_codon:yes gene_type:complete